MRIGIISTMYTFPWGGSEELWAATAMEALELGHEVVVSVFEWPHESPKLSELRRRGAKVLLRPHPSFSVQRSVFGVTSDYHDVFKLNPDVIVISQGSSFDVLECPDLLSLLYLSPIPFLLVCHWNDDLPQLTDDSRRDRGRGCYSLAFRVLFVSTQNRITAERQLAKTIPNAGLTLNPVNLSDRSYVPWPESKTARFASVGRLDTKLKGQDLLIEALSADQWKQRDWELTLYGSGPDEGYLRALVEFFGLQDRVVFAGYQSDVRVIWAREQVLVMFSRSEGTPLALVEAMLCGRPAIVTDVGGNQEWVTEPSTGFVAEAPVIGLARDALERAWAARDDWEAKGMLAHEFAASRISEPSIPSLLDVILKAWQHKTSVDVTAPEEELERLQKYRALIAPTTWRKTKRLAERYVRRILGWWRLVRAESQERELRCLAGHSAPSKKTALPELAPLPDVTASSFPAQSDARSLSR